MFSNKTRLEFDQLRKRYPTAEAALLPILHAAQREVGFIDSSIVDAIADYLSLPQVKVHGVVTFYTMYNKEKPGKYLIQMCRTLSCELRGSEALVAHLKQKLGIDEGETTSDGKFSLMLVECLGSCGTAPVVQINDDYYEDLTPDGLSQILDGLE
ncbi:NADH-quinone oxidoreductase subunit NuoE [Acidobacteriota bacterium]